MDIIGTDLEQLSQIDRQVSGQLRSLSGIQNVRSNYAFGAGELQVIPNRERLAEVGVAEADVGTVVEASLGGRLASNFIDGNEELDVSVELQDTFVETPEQLRQLSLYTSRRQRIQLSDVAEVRETTGPDVVN
ncbi:efflux RND transporter permease subunit, partial [Pediococcus acidilactici]|uniref:efflux RND transporter permease subunit n=1 Tax=Pediococcus acidilactici TaxID=1254 RepID=UPI00319575C4